MGNARLFEALERRTFLSTTTYLSDLSWSSASNDFGPVEKDMSNGGPLAGDGAPLTLNGTTYYKGVGVHANSDIVYNLGGNYSTFLTDVGVDDEVGTQGAVVFQIWVDAVKVYDSGVMTGASPTQVVSLDVTGKQSMELVVSPAGNDNAYDHADWAGARLVSGQFSLPLPSPLPTATPLNGTPFGSPGSWMNSGNTFDKALDSNSTTFFDAPTGSNDYVGLDLGASNTITSVHLVPRSGFAYRMLGGKIQGSPDGVTYTDLYTLNFTPADNIYTNIAIPNPAAYRYVRYLAPDNAYGNIAELQFFGSPAQTPDVKPAPAPTPAGQGLTASYFNSATLSGTPTTEVDGSVNFNWNSTTSVPGATSSAFSARWTGQVQPTTTGTYTFSAPSDGAVRLWVDNLLVIDDWTNPNAPENNGLINLTAGKKYDIQLEYAHLTGSSAAVQLLWNLAGQAAQVIPTAALSSVITPARAQRVIYVDNQNPAAADSNPGTQAAPLKSITAAANQAIVDNKQNIATRVIINPGTYRETLTLNRTTGETDAPISFEAAQAGTVILDGADIWTGWQGTADATVFTHPWSGKWGAAATPNGWPTTPELMRRREILFVNGKLMTPVLSQAALVDNSFFVDDTAGQVYMKLPAGKTPAASTFEWGMRGSLVKLDTQKNVTLTGLTIQHDASTFYTTEAVSFPNSSNILIQDCTIQWNSQGGLSDSNARNIIERRDNVSNNGGTGVGGYQIKTLIMEDITASANNWRGGLTGFIGWAYGGLKQLYVHDAIYRNFTAVGNHSVGLWFDTDCSNILVDHATVRNNDKDGFFLEADEGPITIQNSVIDHNAQYGVRDANSGYVNLFSNILYGNVQAQINISGDNTGRTFTNFETGQQLTTQSQNWKMNDNQIVSLNANQPLIKTDLNAQMWQFFAASLVSDRNLFWNPATPTAFQRDGGIRMDLPAWRVNTKQDANSFFADPKYQDPTNYNFTRQP
jgi:hypothetical protein